MAKRVIYAGVTTNDGKGDTLKVGAQKINDNFTELYTALGADTGSLSVVSGLVAGAGITVSSQAGLVTVTSKIATDVVLGGVKIGDNLNITEDGVLSANPGNYSLPVATGGTLGGVKVTGTDGISISGTGVISVTPYSLPTATSSVLGGIKIGSRLTITDGVLSATDQSYTLPKATDHSLGGVIVDGSTITINSNGVISVSSAGNRLVNGIKEVVLDADGKLVLPLGGDIVDSNGTSVLGANGSSDRLVSGDATLLLNSNNDLTIPGVIKPTAGPSYIDIYDSNIVLQSSSGVTWQFDSSGIIRTANTFTKTTSSSVFNSTPEIVWTATEDYVSGVKLTIQVEANEAGDSSGWHSQVCEAIIASRGYAGVYSGPGGEPQMTVYGVTHTSVAPLVTFTVQRNSTTKKIEVVGTLTAAVSPVGAALRIYSVETATRD